MTKRPEPMRITCATLFLMLTACSTSVVQMDAGTYMIARSAKVGDTPPTHAEAKAYKTANAFCRHRGWAVVKTIEFETDDGDATHPGGVSLKFKCVPPPLS